MRLPIPREFQSFSLVLITLLKTLTLQLVPEHQDLLLPYQIEAIVFRLK